MKFTLTFSLPVIATLAGVAIGTPTPPHSAESTHLNSNALSVVTSLASVYVLPRGTQVQQSYGYHDNRCNDLILAPPSMQFHDRLLPFLPEETFNIVYCMTPSGCCRGYNGDPTHSVPYDYECVVKRNKNGDWYLLKDTRFCRPRLTMPILDQVNDENEDAETSSPE